MSWTNITIPQRFETNTNLRDQLELLNFQKSQLEKRIDYYEKEFANIFEAAKEHKIIDITFGKEKIKLKLIE